MGSTIEYLKVDNSELILNDHRIPNWHKSDTIINYVNKVGEECLNIENLRNSDEPGIRVIGEFYKIYERQLAEENALDFSSIQLEVLRLLNDNPEILDTIRTGLKYFMIDEYQDTNTIQEKIILLLSGKNNNLCVVGDDDQGLYRFRGATINWKIYQKVRKVQPLELIAGLV